MAPADIETPTGIQDRAAQVVAASRRVIGLAEGSKALLASAVILGTGILVARSVLGRPLLGSEPLGIPFMAWAAAGLLIPSVLWAVHRVRRDAMGVEDAALWLDIHSGATGQVVTALERPGSANAWGRAAAQRAEAAPSLPASPGGPVLGRAAIAAALVAAATFAPVHVPTAANGAFEALFEGKLEEVREQLEALEEEVDMADADAEELERALERLEETANESPDLESTYEAIDRLEEQLAERAEEALAEAEKAVDGLRASELAAKSGEPMDMDGLAEALELAASIEFGAELAAALPEQLADALSAGLDGLEPGEGLGLDPEALAKLAKAGGLGELSEEQLAALSDAVKEAMKESLGKLAGAGLLEGSALKGLDGLPELTAEQLAMLEPEPCPDCGSTDPKKPGEP